MGSVVLAYEFVFICEIKYAYLKLVVIVLPIATETIQNLYLSRGLFQLNLDAAQ